MNPAELWKPTSKAFINNPYDAFREIRKSGAVFKANTGDFVILGYNECKQVLQSPLCKTGLRLEWAKKMVEKAAENGESLDHVVDALGGMLIQLNPPRQQAMRSDIAKSWPGIEELKQISHEAIEYVFEDLPSEFDAMEYVCRKVPLYVICSLLGLPKKEAENYANDGINLVRILGPYLTYRDILSIGSSTESLQSFLRKHLLSNDYVPTKLTQQIHKNYPEKEMINILLFLFIAGFETTSSLLATCFYQLLKNRIHVDKIKKYGASSFIKETLRLYSPVQLTGRTNVEPVELGGLSIPKNAALTLCLGAANLDPSHFDRPEEFVWDRQKNDHLSFGYGMHYCLGSQLAEIEAEVLIEKLLPMLDRLEVVNKPILRDQFTIKSYQSFDLKFK